MMTLVATPVEGTADLESTADLKWTVGLEWTADRKSTAGLAKTRVLRARGPFDPTLAPASTEPTLFTPTQMGPSGLAAAAVRKGKASS